MYKFNGFDWTELGEALGIPDPEAKAKRPYCKGDDPFKHEKLYARRIRRRLLDMKNEVATGCLKDSRTPQDIKLVRSFVRKLARNSKHTCGPLIVGLSKIKCDETFLRYTALLLQHLWTNRPDSSNG